ncbi:MAG: flagellar basal body P-ring protein FlgI [Gammaproteobacteria bacterium]|jgi:flagellar P-ring protein precursor FlgI|nr:flagellar basal body P-ring protein FlgI [Gammaproteobacteria bacterium]MBK9468195.1 flagellar basal body P-ring protein FlgI [Gammaproteobacteria bacterium]
MSKAIPLARLRTSLARRASFLGAVALVLLSCAGVARAERLKDIAALAGVRNNHLIGYGLVVGLDETGDQTTQAPFTSQSLMRMLRQFGIALPEGMRLQLKNIAAVAVHAQLPPFAKPGQTIDVTVSSLANAKSLRGGTLLLTPLKGVDGEVYALAQGDLVVGGFGAEGQDGSRVTVNVVNAGRIANGAIVERGVETSFTQGSELQFNLLRPDFTTAKHVAERINGMLGSDVANALDAGTVHVRGPQDADQRVSFVSLLENLEVEPGEAPARVVINSRTGTIVVGNHVSVEPVAVTHGSMTVVVTENPQVSQPGPFGGLGRTVVTPQSDVQIDQEGNRMWKLAGVTTLDQLVEAVNSVGAAPGDLMAILEALKQSGALRADLIVI